MQEPQGLLGISQSLALAKVLTVDHNPIIIDRRVVDLDALEIEIVGILCIEHTGSKVWDVLTGVTLSGDVNLVALHVEGLDEMFPEIIELVRDIELVADCGGARREASPGWLIDIDQVCQIGPRVWVPNGFVSSGLPEEGTIFLQQAIERAASRTAIEPDSNLKISLRSHCGDAHTSLDASGLVDGKNQKNRLELPCGVLGRRPA